MKTAEAVGNFVGSVFVDFCC